MGLRTMKKRRKQGKTDYKLRLGLLKSGIARIVIRKTNRYIIVQLVESSESKDKVVIGLSSNDLIKNGWDKKFAGSLKSVPACYLTGLLFAKKVGNTPVILDLGLQRTISGGRIFSVVKGLVDGGVKLKVDEKIFPSEDRLEGKHLKPEVQSLIKVVKEKIKNGN